MKRITWKKRAAIAAACIAGILAIAFFIYTARYYHADASAMQALESSETVQVRKEQNCYFFDGPGEKTAYVFYPGAKVETESYASLVRRIAEGGIDVFLTDMPFHLAFFGMNRAGQIIENHTEYESWFIGGHSLGGAMAANYAAGHADLFDGAILFASYPTKSLQKDGFRVFSFYGSEDLVLNRSSLEKGRAYMPEDYTEVEIAGGNHAQFGNYGEQKGDGSASISAEEQQKKAVDVIEESIAVR
ncbi:MAG: alpha/beta hydrolase [Lachnospiraceae bacterium]|nr:alpha/beta hydrolase [Lachnospiraceae bacterium]